MCLEFALEATDKRDFKRRHLREFCATLGSAYKRCATFQCWVDARKSLISTNQGVVGSNPASRAIFKGLGPQNQVLHVTVGPLWDGLSTAPRLLSGAVIMRPPNSLPYPVQRTLA